MPLAANVDDLAFASLLRMRGEVVTFRGTKFCVLINRAGPKPGARLPANVALQTGAVIQFPPATEKPKLGESVTDRKGITHTIGEVKFLGHCWECGCETNV